MGKYPNIGSSEKPLRHPRFDAKTGRKATGAWRCWQHWKSLDLGKSMVSRKKLRWNQVYQFLLWMGQRNPNYQLIGGKHPIIDRSTIPGGAGFCNHPQQVEGNSRLRKVFPTYLERPRWDSSISQIPWPASPTSPSGSSRLKVGGLDRTITTYPCWVTKTLY